MYDSIKKLLQKYPYWKEINPIILKLSQQGFQTLIVGGAVRDALLNKPIKDIDLASSAQPKQILKIFPKSNSSFAKYGVIFIPLKNNHKIEITTFRKDSSYKDGRRPQSIKYSSIKEDANRRDFTINALFYDVKKDKVIDLVKGLRDLKNKKIRTVGKAEKRFKEDYLRMLRALRLAHQLNFKLDKDIKLSLLKLNHNITAISQERVLDELMKMLFMGKIDRALKSLNDYGLFQYVFPQLAFLDSNFQNQSSLTAKNSSFKKKHQFHLKNQDLIEKTSTHISTLSNKKSASKPPINIKSIQYFKFWKKDFSYYADPAFCWTVVGLPFFYSDTKSFERFLKTYPIKTTVIKQAVSYLKSVQTLIKLKSSFTEKLLAFNGQKKQVYELSSHFLKSGNLQKKEIQKLKKDLKLIFKEFNKREIKGRLPPALVKGADLLKLASAVKKQNFSKILQKAYCFQMEQPEINKREILKKLGYTRN